MAKLLFQACPQTFILRWKGYLLRGLTQEQIKLKLPLGNISNSKEYLLIIRILIFIIQVIDVFEANQIFGSCILNTALLFKVFCNWTKRANAALRRFWKLVASSKHKNELPFHFWEFWRVTFSLKYSTGATRKISENHTSFSVLLVQLRIYRHEITGKATGRLRPIVRSYILLCHYKSMQTKTERNCKNKLYPVIRLVSSLPRLIWHLLPKSCKEKFASPGAHNLKRADSWY